MKLEQAIHTAIEFETKVRQIYLDAASKARDEQGRRIFEVLGQEEQGHLDFLVAKLEEWRTTGHVTASAFATVVPAADVIARGLQLLEGKVAEKKDRSLEIDLLKRALDAERATGDFYRRMVSDLEPEGQKLFEPFVRIEEGHYAIVQAQIDALNGMGFWFDFMEFSLEAG